MIKIAQIIPDNRDEFRQYNFPEPIFGPAPDALLSGLAQLSSKGECEVHVLSCSRAPSQTPERIYNGSIHYHQIPVSPLGYLKTLYRGCVKALRRELLKISPDIVHGQGTERYCSLAAVRSGFPNLITLHGNMRSVAKIHHARPFSFHWLAARLESWTLPRTGGVICLSHATQERVQNLAPQTWVIPNAVDEKFLHLNLFSSSKHAVPFRLICLGTICLHKNQNWLIQALAPLHEKFNFELHLYGKPEPGSSYTAEFNQLLSHHSWVKTHGFIPHDQLPDIYAGADLLLIPSIEDNCPMVILEAMACGTPAIGARIGGIPDLIRDGKTGFLYESQNADQLRRILSDLFQEPSRLKPLQQESVHILRTYHTPLQIASRHLEVFREFLNQKI